MSQRKLRVLGFAGSLRARSFNRALLQAALELAPEEVEVEIFDLSVIPLYNGDLEESAFPQSVSEFKEKIRQADALLIATPEYNYSVPEKIGTVPIFFMDLTLQSPGGEIPNLSKFVIGSLSFIPLKSHAPCGR